MKALGMRHEALGACDLGMDCLCDLELGNLQAVRAAIARDHAKGEEQAKRDNRAATVERLRSYLRNRNLPFNTGVNKNWKRMKAKERAA